MSHTLRSGFPPPPQHPPGRRSFDLSPKAVNEWLESLPIGFPEASAKKLLTRVHEVNRLSVPEEQRLRFFLDLGEQAHALLQTLHIKLRDVAAPPRKKEMELAELVILLHSELALGYRSTVDWQAGNQPIRKHPLASRSTLLNRALHHLFRSLKVHYLINVEPSDEIWERTYALYALAEDGGVLTEASSPFPGQVAKTVEDTFKTILLVALSAPQSLRGIELDALWDILLELAPYAGLVPAQEATRRESTFLIGLYSGLPPKMYVAAEHHRFNHASESLELDVAPLISVIRHRLKALGQHKDAEGFRPVSSRRILKHLKSRLGPQRLRHSKRIAGEFVVDVIAGFREVHHFLSGEETNAGPDDALAGNQQHEPQRQHPLINYNVALDLESARIETRPYYYLDDVDDDEDEDGGVEALFAKEKLDARQARCKTLNFSGGGYFLATDNTKDFHLKAGEFIAVRDGDSNRWLPGSVIWVTSDGHQLHFGVNLLAPFCQPGKARFTRDQETKSAECLLLLDDEQAQPSRILLSPSDVKEGTTFSVECGGNNLTIALHKELTRTPGYIEFQCGGISPRGDGEETTLLSGDARKKESPNVASEVKTQPRPRPWKQL